MTQQFKFGDRVARKNETPDYDKAFIVISAKDNGEICVFSSISKLPFDMQAKDYQLVPHPDTVRLDWLEKNRAILYHNIAEDIKHGCAPIEVGCWHGEKPHGGCTVREAIDTAMREKAA